MVDTRELSEKFTAWGAFRVKPWLERQVQRGRLNPLWIPRLQDMETILQEIFPDNWDIYTKFEFTPVVNPSGTRKLEIHFQPVIRFPEIEITNSRKGSHTIKDLYVKLPFVLNRDRISIVQIEGTRGKLTIAEVNSNYLHSHLSNTVLNFTFSLFCLGRGEIVQIMQRISAEYSSNLFRMLLYQLKNVVAWESLEGRPYRRLANIASRSGSVNDLNASFAVNYIDSIERRIQKEKSTFNWVLKDGLPYIVDDLKFEQAILWAGNDPSRYGRYGAGLVFRRDDNGEYFGCNGAAPDPNTYQHNYIYFRGKKVFLEIVDAPDHEKLKELNAQLYIHPKIKQYVKQHFESKAFIYQLRTNNARRIEAQSSNAGEGIPADQVFVQGDS